MRLVIALKQQFNRNILAIISLIIAISALGYNSWRNEQSEENRNYRAAGFEIMRESAHLQRLVDVATYTNLGNSSDFIEGWVHVNLILSLSELMPEEVRAAAVNLKQVWKDNWSSLENDEQANETISDANKKLMVKVRLLLVSLR